mgnify:FL=1
MVGLLLRERSLMRLGRRREGRGRSWEGNGFGVGRDSVRGADRRSMGLFASVALFARQVIAFLFWRQERQCESRGER